MRNITTPTGYNDWEMYAGLGSGLMGDLQKTPPELLPYYEPIFTGEGSLVGQQEKWRPTTAFPVPIGYVQYEDGSIGYNEWPTRRNMPKNTDEWDFQNWWSAELYNLKSIPLQLQELVQEKLYGNPARG